MPCKRFHLNHTGDKSGKPSREISYGRTRREISGTHLVFERVVKILAGICFNCVLGFSPFRLLGFPKGVVLCLDSPELNRLAFTTADMPSRLGSVKDQQEVLDTFARTKQHLADAGVRVDQAKMVVGQHLRIDDEKEQFIDNARADQLLSREYRNPFVVPQEST